MKIRLFAGVATALLLLAPAHAAESSAPPKAAQELGPEGLGLR
jgi:hypothetical protein